MHRGRHVSPDTQRRSAERPLHDRPAVNGRAQSPSRLKPADPNGPCTRPIDPGAWAPHSPLQGACALSPGLQPRAFAADRPGSEDRGTTAPFGVDLPALAGLTGQAVPDPYGAGYRPTVAGRRGTGDASAHSCRGEALPRPPGGTPGNPPRPLTATHLCGRSPVCDPGHRESTPHTVDRRWRDGRPSGPAGQATPDPDNTGRYHPPVGHSCLTGDVLGSPAGTMRCIAQLRRRRRTASGRCPTPARQRTRWSGRRPESWPGTAMPTSARRLGTYSGVDHR